jgi:hypothetical protein
MKGIFKLSVVIYMMFAIVPKVTPVIGADEVRGIIEGRFVWADGSPVVDCEVKLFDKLEHYKAVVNLRKVR